MSSLFRNSTLETVFHPFPTEVGLPPSPESSLFQKNSRRLELSISKHTPLGRWGQGPGFPGAQNPRICSSSRCGEKFSSNFRGIFPEFSSGTPEQTPETATAFSSFMTSLRGSHPKHAFVTFCSLDALSGTDGNPTCAEFDVLGV